MLDQEDYRGLDAAAIERLKGGIYAKPR